MGPCFMTYEELLEYLKSCDSIAVNRQTYGKITLEWDIDPQTAKNIDNPYRLLDIQRFLESIGLPGGGQVCVVLYRDDQFAALEWTGPVKKGALFNGVTLY